MSRTLSPLSVPYRVVERGGSIVFTAVILFSGASAAFGPAGGVVGVVLVGLALLALVAYEVAYHRRFEYDLDADTLDIRSGVISRRNREIPIRRIQNVDISRNVVQRLLGIAAVDFETAGGSETEASLRFVAFEEAKRLQREIGRLKRAGSEAGDEADQAEPPTATELFALSPRELALVGALSFDVRIPGLLFVLLSGSVPAMSSVVPVESGAFLVAVGLVTAAVGVLVVSWLAGAAVAVLNYYDFRLTQVEDELQYERGLLRRYDGSIPLDKVQTLTVVDDPLKRYFGYASLHIETAGYAPGDSGSEAAVPLADRERVFALADRIEPIGSPTFSRPPKRVRRRYAVRYLLALGALVGLLYGADLLTAGAFPWPPYAPVPLALLAPVAAHYKWRHRGYWLGPDHVVTRNGFLRRRIKIVPYYRIQTVIDSRTLFQRRWDVATVTADTAGSRSLVGDDAAAVDVDGSVADDLRVALPTRLRAALAARRGWGDADDGTGETSVDADADADDAGDGAPSP